MIGMPLAMFYVSVKLRIIDATKLARIPMNFSALSIGSYTYHQLVAIPVHPDPSDWHF